MLTLLTLGCLLIDVGFWLSVGAALKWLAAMSSPWTLAGLAALIILTARIGWSVRSATFEAARG